MGVDTGWVGNGTNRPCMGCDLPIRPETLEYELDLPTPADHPVMTLRLHKTCVAIWHEERARLQYKE